jgi:hypothetical protein
VAGRSEVKRQFGRHRHTWEDNNKIDLKEVEWRPMDWIALAQERDKWQMLGNRVINLRGIS